MKRIVSIAVGSAALAVAFTGGAWADGMPAARRAPVAAPTVVENRCGYGPWNGFYIGGNLGAAWSESDFRDVDHMFIGNRNDNRGVFNHTNDNFTGGVQAGYNYQCKNVVFGFETDFNGVTGGNNDDRRFFFNREGELNQFRMNDNMSWFGTIRGRVGWTDNKYLVYATGGAAYSNLNHNVRGLDFFDDFHRFDDNDVRWGWTAGGGVEYLHSPNLTFKVEALWMDFGQHNHDEFDTFCDGTCFTDRFRFEREDQLWTLRVGVNYLFGVRQPEVVPLK
jgi:outer membrane immunogenic protein